jgi:predicted DNA-binding ribbon-helix-helix protein
MHEAGVRASMRLYADLYETLEEIAQQKKFSRSVGRKVRGGEVYR